VIVLLPRLSQGMPARTVLPWPGRGLRTAITVVAVGFALVFVADYGLARQLYGLAALVHSWLEIPVLLLALGGLAAVQPESSPAAVEAALATSDASKERRHDSDTMTR
jgi:hypothetical protein